MKPSYSFHSHTYRCGHASGDIEDYVKEAIKHDFKLLGTSDHVFLPGVHEPYMRGEYELLDSYIEIFNKVKDKYGDQIEMHLGFECEYSEIFRDYYASLLKENKVEYLLCGQHCQYDKSLHALGYFNYRYIDNEPGIEEYMYDVIDAIRSGLFFYIAHPDLFMYSVTEITPFIKHVFIQIIDNAVKYDIPLELNVSGYYRDEDNSRRGTIGYPCKEFWKLAKEKGAKIIFGGDYHSVEAFSDTYCVSKLNNLIEELGLELCNPDDEFKKYKNKINKSLKNS